MVPNKSKWSAVRPLMLFVGLAFGSANPVATKTMSPSEAPAEWVHYAEEATAQITQWLQAENETAQNLRAYLDGTRPAPDQPTPPLTIKIWVKKTGVIRRIEYPAFPDADANMHLHKLIVGQKLPNVPPKNILLPIRISVQLNAPNADAP